MPTAKMQVEIKALYFKCLLYMYQNQEDMAHLLWLGLLLTLNPGLAGWAVLHQTPHAVTVAEDERLDL